MNFFSRLKVAFSNSYFERYVENFLSGADLTPETVGQETALKYSAFFGCNRVLAETFASVAISEYKKLRNGDREVTDDTGLLSILKYAPNDETSRYNFQECQMYQINLGGNFVAERLTEVPVDVVRPGVPFPAYDDQFLYHRFRVSGQPGNQPRRGH